MFALTTIVVGADEQPRVERGSLEPLPPELVTPERVRQYCGLAKSGWSVDDWGYKLFCRPMPSGERLIVPGLEIVGETRARRRFHGHVARYNRQQIEQFVNGVATLSQQENRRVQSSLNMLIHDLRSLSTTILHSNREAGSLLYRDPAEAEVRIGNVEAAQGILRMRIDAFDLLGNDNAIMPRREVPVFKKVDKVVRFFKSSAGSDSKRIFLSGSSRRLVTGPDVFELVPFSLIDNAIKYAPGGSTIQVSVSGDEKTRILVTSFGPKIKKTEEKTIFTNGARGAGAIDSGLPGTGVGLYLVSKIVRDFYRGDVWVQQSQSSENFDGIDVFETTFTVEVPSPTSS